MILMQGDFFQVLRRVQREERNKGALARVDNDFYKQLRDYIKQLENSVANNPFGNEQLLLNNAQRIATEICEKREEKITKAANNNIYRSFLLFKKDNPQFDLLDTTPLNLTDEEETLYFALMDALKNHRYRISLDEYAEDSTMEEDYDEGDMDIDDDEDTSFVEDSYESAASIDSDDEISEDWEDEISNALDQSTVDVEPSVALETQQDGSADLDSGSDEVLDKLNQIKDAKVVTDEKYESIDKQVANQMYPNQEASVATQDEIEEGSPTQAGVVSQDEIEKDSSTQAGLVSHEEVKAEAQEQKEESADKTSKGGSFDSNNINDIFKNPDDQFVDLSKLEPNYNDDYYAAIASPSNYAQPTEDDFNMIFAKPKKPKSNEEKLERSQVNDEVKSENSQFTNEAKSEIPQSTQAELGFSSGLDVKERKTSPTDAVDKDIQKLEEDNAPKKVADKTKGGLFTRDEIKNATVVIKENVGELIGIDGKVYGPFLENDIVILPNITAQILIDNNKASLVKL